MHSIGRPHGENSNPLDWPKSTQSSFDIDGVGSSRGGKRGERHYSGGGVMICWNQMFTKEHRNRKLI